MSARDLSIRAGMFASRSQFVCISATKSRREVYSLLWHLKLTEPTLHTAKCLSQDLRYLRTDVHPSNQAFREQGLTSKL